MAVTPPTKLYTTYEAEDPAGNPQGGVAAFVMLYPPTDGSTTAMPPPGTSAANPLYVSGGGGGGGTSSTVTLAAGTAQAGTVAVSGAVTLAAGSSALGTVAVSSVGGTSAVAGSVSILGTPTVTASGTVAVSSVGGTSAVSGTVSLAGTSAVAGTVAVSSVGGTVAISAAALPLPSGAATSAAQPALNADGGALAHVTNFPATQPVSGAVAANQGTPAANASAWPVVQQTVTYAAPAASSVATGGTAVTALAAGSILHGFDLANPSGASEALFFNLTGTATTTAAGPNFALLPGQSYHGTFGTGQALSVNAATSGHTFMAMAY